MSTVDTTPPPVPTPSPWGRTLSIALGLPAVIAVFLLAFTWPALTSDPHDVEIAVVGPEEAVTAVQDQLTAESDVFEVSTLADREEAVEAIESREISGAIVLGTEPELLTASANGTVNQLITQLADPLQQAIDGQAQAAAAASGQEAPEVTVTTTDVVPYSEDDPSGSLLASTAFPLLFGGMIGGIALALLVQGNGRRIAAVVVYAVVGGVVLDVILQGWFGAVSGDAWTNIAAFSLAIGAIAAPILGAVAFLGRAGISVGPLVMMLFANPISGAQIPAQFLPGSWGTVGQWFPPGAASTLIRELSYFPTADMLFPWLVLGGWTLGGLLLVLLGHGLERRTRARRTASAVEIVED